RTAWDHFLPGHTAGWHGDLNEAIRCYQAALRIQPNHYDSLYFLGMRLSRNEINRHSEAITVYTACIAIRPEEPVAYVNRSYCYLELGQLEDAEADITAAIAMGENIHRYARRYRIYKGLG